jgi:hypothetical protein
VLRSGPTIGATSISAALDFSRAHLTKLQANRRVIDGSGDGDTIPAAPFSTRVMKWCR